MNQNKLRSEALGIVNDVFTIGSKYVRHQRIFAFFQLFFKPRLEKIILFEATEADIKAVMWAIKQKIDPMFTKMDTVKQITDTKYNDPVMIRQLMKLPDFEGLKELLD